ncbi:MAG: CRTAC1 family protein [Thermoanaerobaculia bacterium]
MAKAKRSTIMADPARTLIPARLQGLSGVPVPVLAVLVPVLVPVLAVLGLQACSRGGEEPGPGPEASAPGPGVASSSPPPGEGRADGAAPRPLPLPEGPLFVDRTEPAGLDFHHFNGRTGAYYMPENIGSGGALLDYDGDGDLDLYLVQGTLLEPGDGAGASMADAVEAPRHPEPLTDRLYRNDTAPGPDGRPVVRFTDVTAETELPEALYGMGAAAGDYDNDGRPDLYVSAFGRNRLLRNRGDGTFEDVTRAAGVDDPRWSVPAVFFDYDGDGWLDLWVGSYLDFRFEEHRLCTTLTGSPDYCDPSVYDPLPDRLFRNLGAAGGSGDGAAGGGAGERGGVTFEDVTAAAGLAESEGKALGALAADLTGDGRLDLYVANDGTPNHLWVRGGDGTFRDEALLAGCAVNGAGLPEAGMGVDAGDFDGDGHDDLVMVHFTGETHTLYLADGTGGFLDATDASGLGPPSLEANGFGAGWLDVDNDGLLDLLVANGAVRALEEQVRAGDPYPFRQRNQLFRNVGSGRLEEVTDRAGEAFEPAHVSRGALFGDLDDDGDTDVVITNSSGPARLLVNAVGQDRPWLGVRAVVRTPSGAVRDALGARVGLIRAGRPVAWRRAAADGSYASSNDPRALFGLGEGPPPEAVRIVWPDGAMEEWDAPEPGRYVTLEKGTGRAVR